MIGGLMEIVSFPTPGLGDQTHLFVHDKVGILVDPQRDIDRFLAAAQERDVQIRWVLETHLHNDYVSGAEQAALAADAELVLPAAAAAAYPHTPAFHLEELPTHGGIGIRPIHTPGHTPEHTSYLVSIHRAPVGVFTGGSLLVSSAGRPDLLGPERADTLARLQHRSIHRLAALPGEVALYPTHGAGSFCTATGAGQAHSTIATEVRDNPLLALPDAAALSRRLLAEPMPIPAFYPRMSPANLLGVPPMPTRSVPTVPLGTVPPGRLVDLRPREQQAKGFVPGSLTIEHGTDFGSWAGWLLPADEPIVLIADAHQGEEVDDAVTQLAQIGVDSVVGVVTDVTAAAEHREFQLVDVEGARSLLASDAQVLDVRMPHERARRRVPGAVERFLPDVFADGIPPTLDPHRPTLIACASGRRACIAAGHLADHGFDARVLSGAGVPELVA